MAKEEARRCKRCDYRWYAERVMKPQKPTGAGDFYALGGWHGAAASRGATAAAKYQQKMERFLKWKECPNCGSTKVASVSRSGFEPTGAIRTSAPPPQPPPPPPAPPAPVAGAKTCDCGMTLSPAWRFCPMCASPAA